MEERRRRRTKSDEESEDLSSESEHEAVDVEAKNSSDNGARKEQKANEEEVESPTELIDEEGGEEGIAEPEEVGEEFLGGGLIDATDEDEEGEATGINGVPAEKEEELDDNEHEDEEDEGDEDEEEDEGCVEEERQQGDGEECSPSAEKELDFDEDRRNPQYIPKKGTFYEHDDRNSEETVKEKEPENPRDKKKKKLWLDEGKWGHDRYREDEQIPKSRDELIQVYGYDIRCEDGPPRARRRRRYGRGPTKYDRNWKDETAYAKEHLVATFRGRPRGTRGRGRGRGQFRGRVTYSNSGRKVIDDTEKTELEGSVPEMQPPSNPMKNNGAVLSNGWDRENELVEEASKDFKPIVSNTKEFPSLPTKERIVKEQSPDRSISYNRKQVTLKVEVPLYNNNITTTTNNNNIISNNSSNSNNINNSNNSVKSQTFENSNLNSTSKEIPYDNISPRRGKMPTFRGSTYRTAYKRPPRAGRGRRGNSSSGRFNNRYSYRPNLAPRLMDKQIRAINSEIDRLTLQDKDDDFEVQESVDIGGSEDAIQEQNKHGSKLTETSNVSASISSSKNEDSSSRPKRYSSLRQRGVQEPAAYQPAQTSVQALPLQHTPYYETGYQATMYTTDAAAAGGHPQSTGSPPIISPPQYQTYNYQDGYALRLPVGSTPPRLFPQVTLPAPQTIIAPTPSCIAPNPGIINYPAPPPPPTTAYPQFTYQQYTTPPPPPPPPPVSQPPDMYRGGITYYFPQTQPQPVRHAPQKRPKAAIPIVPPPENETTKLTEKTDSSQVSNQVPSQNGSTVSSADAGPKTDSSVVEAHAPVQVES